MKTSFARPHGRLIMLATLCLAPLQPGAAQHVSYVDPAAIDRAVAQFTGQTIGVPGGARQPVDRRLRLASCNAPYRLGWYGESRQTIQVDCPDAGGWRIFVPLVPAGGTAAGNQGIRRGDMITLAYRGSGFTVQQQGKAQESGVPGDWIMVLPVAGVEALQARVEHPGLAVIGAR